MYLLRWQLSTPILSIVIYFTIDKWGNLVSTMLANLIGGLMFYKIDKLIFQEVENQLTKEQQTLWRKEIEQACISGGEVGVELARDPRYKENFEVKEVNLDKEMDKEWNKCEPIDEGMGLEIASIEHEQFDNITKHFFELGLKAQKGE